MTNCKNLPGQSRSPRLRGDSNGQSSNEKQKNMSVLGHLTLPKHHYDCWDCENIYRDVGSLKLQGFPTFVWKFWSQYLLLQLVCRFLWGPVTCLHCSNLTLFKDKEVGKVTAQNSNVWGLRRWLCRHSACTSSVEIWVQIPSTQVKSLWCQCGPVISELGIQAQKDP